MLSASSHRLPPGKFSPVALSTLVRLRFVAIFTQLITLAIARVWLTPHLPYWSLLAVVALLAATNVALSFRLRTLDAAKSWVTATILLDVVLLTILLGLSGGAHNPFTVLYVVHVALTALLLGPWELLLVLVACTLGYASLFVCYVPLPACLGGHSSDGSGFSIHLHGMWVAFVVASVATAAFMYRMALAIQRERETNERHLRLLGLATLAAGAAHEIGNPLATIKIAASELKSELETLGDRGRDMATDASLIVSEVERAWKAVRGLSVGAGELTGEPLAPIAVSDLLRRLREQVEPGSIELDVHTETPAARMRLPAQAVVTALTQVVRNAMQASPAGAVVELEAALTNSQLHFLVLDRGPGIPDDILRRLGEPFLTTKEPGHGMGLGLFVTRALVEHLSGKLTFSRRAGGGTSVSILLPASEVA